MSGDRIVRVGSRKSEVSSNFPTTNVRDRETLTTAITSVLLIIAANSHSLYLFVCANTYKLAHCGVIVSFRRG